MPKSDLTPVEQRMMDVLADGLPHTPQELHACLWDELSPLRNIRAHVTRLRTKLRPSHTVTTYGLNGSIVYRLTRFLDNPYNGHR